LLKENENRLICSFADMVDGNTDQGKKSIENRKT